jgi:hypothetical protein
MAFGVFGDRKRQSPASPLDAARSSSALPGDAVRDKAKAQAVPARSVTVATPAATGKTPLSARAASTPVPDAIRSALPTRAQAVQDKTLGKPLTFKSSLYDKVLEGLDHIAAAHNTIARPDQQKSQAGLLQLKEAHETLIAQAKRYLESPKTRRSGVAPLIPQACAELKLIAKMIDAWDVSHQPFGVVPHDAVLAYLRLEPLLSAEQIKYLWNNGSTPKVLAGNLKDNAAFVTGQQDRLKAAGYDESAIRYYLIALHGPLNGEATHPLYPNLRQSDVFAGMDLGRPPDHIAQANASCLPVTQRFQPDHQLVQGTTPRLLGSGATTTVYTVEVESLSKDAKNKDAKSSLSLAVLKPPPARQVFPQAATGAGISANFPMWQFRTLASARVDQALGLECAGPAGLVLHNNQLCSVAALAPGMSTVKSGDITLTLPEEAAAQFKTLTPAALTSLAQRAGWQDMTRAGNQLRIINSITRASPESKLDERQRISQHTSEHTSQRTDLNTTIAHDYQNGALRCALTRLQWFDCLTGQIDRSAQNIFLEQGPSGTWRATGIDHDLSFGAALTDPNWVSADAARSHLEVSPSRHFKGCRLPAVIDPLTRDALLNLKPAQLTAAMAGLSDAEISAGQSRLTAIQTFLTSAEGAVVLKDDEAWASAKTGELLGFKHLDIMDSDSKKQTGIKAALYQADNTSYAARMAFEAILPIELRGGPVLSLAVLQGQAPAAQVLQELGIVASEKPAPAAVENQK